MWRVTEQWLEAMSRWKSRLCGEWSESSIFHNAWQYRAEEGTWSLS